MSTTKLTLSKVALAGGAVAFLMKVSDAQDAIRAMKPRPLTPEDALIVATSTSTSESMSSIFTVRPVEAKPV
jgi:glycine cleavage system regulatory protein